MRKLVLPFLACSLIQARAQNCNVIELLDSSSTVTIAAATLNVDGGLTMAGQTFLTRMLHVSKLALDGTPIWGKYIEATDPSVELRPTQVLPLPDGGSFMVGMRYDSYWNYFGIRLDAEGEVLWARIYMNPLAAEDSYRMPSVVRRPSGNYLLLLTSSFFGPTVAELDTNGIPLNAYRYRTSMAITPPNFNSGTDILLEEDGGFYLTGTAANALWVMRADSAAQPVWSYRYDVPAAWEAHATKAQNGELLIACASTPSLLGNGTTLVRLDTNGQYLDGHYYSIGSGHGVAELSTGDVLVARRGAGPSAFLQMNAAGQPVMGYDYPMPWWLLNSNVLLSVQNDSLIALASRLVGSPNSTTQLLVAENLASSTCGLDQSSFQTFASWPTVQVTDTMIVYDDTVKTWTMSVGDPVDYFTLDLVTLGAAGVARPGFEHQYSFWVWNYSGTVGGPVECRMVLDTNEQYVSANPAPTLINGDTLIWTGIPPLVAEGQLSFNVTVQLPPDITLLGQVLETTFTCSQDSVEADLQNNTYTVQSEVVASYDPNDKLVQPSPVFEVGSDSLLHYTIRFQNTGTYLATNVVVVDTLPAEVSVSSFKRGVSSHPYTYDLQVNGVLTFTFNNIMLPDSASDEPGSHGLVSFTVRPRSSTPIGTPISNAADIYFDFNPPVRTEPVVVWYGLYAQVPTVEHASQLRVWPVPVEDELRVELPAAFDAGLVRVIDMQGRVVLEQRPASAGPLLIVPTRGLSAGVYSLLVLDPAGRRAGARFIKTGR